MVASVLAMLLNVLGNWLLIGGELGCPALGVKGAALASSCPPASPSCSCSAGFGGATAAAAAARGEAHWHELWRTLWFGIPSGLNWFFEFLAFSFFVNVVVAGLGTTALAALMAVFQVNGVAFMPAFGIASAGRSSWGKRSAPGCCRTRRGPCGSPRGHLLVAGGRGDHLCPDPRPRAGTGGAARPRVEFLAVARLVLIVSSGGRSSTPSSRVSPRPCGRPATRPSPCGRGWRLRGWCSCRAWCCRAVARPRAYRRHGLGRDLPGDPLRVFGFALSQRRVAAHRAHRGAAGY